MKFNKMYFIFKQKLDAMEQDFVVVVVMDWLRKILLEAKGFPILKP